MMEAAIGISVFLEDGNRFVTAHVFPALMLIYGTSYDTAMSIFLKRVPGGSMSSCHVCCLLDSQNHRVCLLDLRWINTQTSTWQKP